MDRVDVVRGSFDKHLFNDVEVSSDCIHEVNDGRSSVWESKSAVKPGSRDCLGFSSY